jgi:hypothetical protein
VNFSIASLKAVKINNFCFGSFSLLLSLWPLVGHLFHVFIFSRASFLIFKENLEHQEGKLFHALFLDDVDI